MVCEEHVGYGQTPVGMFLGIVKMPRLVAYGRIGFWFRCKLIQKFIFGERLFRA